MSCLSLLILHMFAPFQFVEKFTEAKAAAKELASERQQAARRLQEGEKTLPPAGSSPSPTSPHVKSPSIISPPASTSSAPSKSPSPLRSSPGLDGSETTEHAQQKESTPLEGVEVWGDVAERKTSASSSGSAPLVNGEESPQLDHQHRVTNGHSSEVRLMVSREGGREDGRGRE